MPMSGVCYSVLRGPSSEIIFSYPCNKKVTVEEVTRDFKINAAKVRFKFEHDHDHINCSWSAMRLDSTENSSVKINADCVQLNYSEQCQIYGNNWTSWKQIGKKKFTVEADNLSIYIIVINIKVSEMQTPNAHVRLYEDMDFIDFHLNAADGSVGVHKAFLASHSVVFKRMLQGKWKETTEGCVELKGLTRQTLQHLKDYLYLGTLPDEGLRPLLLLAKYYFIDDLKTKCIEKLVETTTSDTLYALLEFACDNNLPELIFYILQVIPAYVVKDAYNIKKNNVKTDK